MTRETEKPRSMPMIDFFIKKTAIKELVPEQVAELIIKDQWRTLGTAVKHNADVEISGLGYFKTSQKKALAEAKRLTSMVERMKIKVTNEAKINHLNSVITSTEKGIENYKNKAKQYEDRFQRSVTGDVQQTSGSGMEEADSKGEIPESL